MSEANKDTLLEVQDLCMSFGKGSQKVDVLHNVSFNIKEGETYGLVGESGSGKSTIGKCIIGLNRLTGGSVRYDGMELAESYKNKEIRKKQLEIQMIFQDPMSSLNPKKKVGEIIGSALDIQKVCSKNEREERIKNTLVRVGIPPEYAGRYPGQFSGGQRQRIGIARSLVLNPRLIIADECIAALDASVQAQIVNMLKDIKKETKTSFLFISHDLSMVRYLSDRIGVLHLGYLLETGKSDELFKNPVHPYTKSLLEAIPGLHPLIPESKDAFYDYKTSGIKYEDGSWHDITETHKVWCTDREFEKLWKKEGKVQ